MQKQKPGELPAYLKTFPENTNVRLAVTGLAYCRLAQGTSTIKFLRHLEDHQLQLKIYRRRLNAEPELYFPRPGEAPEAGNIPSNVNVAINTTAAAAEPEQISAEIEQCEHRLNELINLRYYHKAPIKEIDPPEVGAPASALTVQNFQYYTLEMMDKTHKLLDGDEICGQRKFGYSLGGKFLAGASGSISIAVGELEPIALPLKESEESWYYDIYFSNHCTRPARECLKPDRDDEKLDFQFYYDVLCEETDTPERELVLILPEGVPMLGVGACNVVIIEPEIDPPQIV